LERERVERGQRARDFGQTLSGPGLRIIAECKRRSPSRGILREAYDPVGIARSYEQAGAAAISVLTEPTFFDGSLDHLRRVRASVGIPVLRKDFIVTGYQIVEAAAAGADAVLLIVAALDDTELASLLALAQRSGLSALVEVHDREQLERARDAGAELIGVNSRNLSTLAVQPELFDELASEIPSTAIAVAESGLRTVDDLVRLRRMRYNAFLIGERFMTDPDPGAALAAFTAAGVELGR
jgi:indole-3-glycerol phosphate synthase